MAADDFFARWSKRKVDAVPPPAALDPAAVVADAQLGSGSATAGKPLPTLADVEGLTADSDYAAFVAKGVDETVKRSAMKKLFALPQFNIMDGLDIYVGDYSQPDPLPPGMLEALQHARGALDPAQFFARPVSPLPEPMPMPMPEQAEQAPAVNPPEPVPLLPTVTTAPHDPAPALPQQEVQPDTPPVLVPNPLPLPLPAAVATHKNEAV
ncbi:DUF3306 domain-containing protein [Herminiimonas sp. CN]|uniref:DUF3306 domain-containing protein n=1 Tax=Herminiimonas sp. CN TaxID=1349818 RepID=UPI000473AEC1|nr:DUF3306 domain-containing protein [Herminiimonas sp. CN]